MSIKLESYDEWLKKYPTVFEETDKWDDEQNAHNSFDNEVKNKSSTQTEKVKLKEMISMPQLVFTYKNLHQKWFQTIPQHVEKFLNNSKIINGTYAGLMSMIKDSKYVLHEILDWRA